MKKQFGTSKFAVGVLVMIGTMMVATTAAAKTPKEVEMEIIDGKLEITTAADANDCPADEPSEKGCIKVKHSKKSEMYFELTGDRSCHEEPGNKWELNAIYLGGYNSTSKPGSFGFDSIDDADYKKVHHDFNIADKATGRVTLISESKTKLGIDNKNEYPYVVWYKIEAICERSDGGEPHIATSDPRVKNGGNL